MNLVLQSDRPAAAQCMRQSGHLLDMKLIIPHVHSLPKPKRAIDPANDPQTHEDWWSVLPFTITHKQEFSAGSDVFQKIQVVSQRQNNTQTKTPPMIKVHGSNE